LEWDKAKVKADLAARTSHTMRDSQVEFSVLPGNTTWAKHTDR
jgi:hypothetical protein